MSGPVRLALLGAGGIAQSYLDVVGRSEVATFVAVADPLLSRATTAADRCGATPFSKAATLLDAATRLGVEGVVIGTPPDTHAELSVAAMTSGLPVLCEKPLAPDRSGAHLMADTAVDTGRLLMMASKFRYVSDVTRAKQLIESGDLGDIGLFRNAFTSVVPMRGRWNAVPEISGGGVVIDNGTHSVDIARYLLGPIREVIAVETRRIQELPVEDTAQILFRTDAGATGTIDLSWSLDTGSPWYCTVDGTKGSVRLGWATAERRRNDGSWETIGTGYSKPAALGAEIADFCRAVRQGTAPLIGMFEANASVAVIDAAYTSMRTRSWERVLEERRRRPRVA